MARFGAKKLPFGLAAGTETEDDGEGLPRPLSVKMQARRSAGIAEAKAVLDCLPGPGESLHAIVTARIDLTDVVNRLFERVGRCESLRIGTLGYNTRNLAALLNWLDAGQVGSLGLVASKFFRSHNGALWTRTQQEFARRGQRLACCYSHAKVVTLSFASGQKYSIEGSANLCGNGSGREQFALIRHDELHDWHAAWIDDLITRHSGCQPARGDSSDGERE